MIDMMLLILLIKNKRFCTVNRRQLVLKHSTTYYSTPNSCIAKQEHDLLAISHVVQRYFSWLNIFSL